jgi:hypothetical protein
MILNKGLVMHARIVTIQNEPMHIMIVTKRLHTYIMFYYYTILVAVASLLVAVESIHSYGYIYYIYILYIPYIYTGIPATLSKTDLCVLAFEQEDILHDDDAGSTPSHPSRTSNTTFPSRSGQSEESCLDDYFSCMPW